jgi:diguanylate cyclase (GGDEF)-like protein
MLQSQKQALRLRRGLLSNLCLLLCIPSAMLASYMGYSTVSHSTLLIYVIIFWLGHLSIVSLVALNWNLRFKDASLTSIQMIWAISGISGLMLVLSDLRVLMLMGYLLIMAFGSFRMSLIDFSVTTFFTVLCYAFTIYLIDQERPEYIHLAQEVFIFIGFIFVMLGFAYLGAETRKLRKALSERHRDLKGAISRIEDLAITDELTGLYNRRNLLKILTQQRALANRSRYGFSVCYLDLDYFKRVNDSYGHPFGDKVLKSFANVITENLREVDVGARIGGEEFVLVLADTKLEEANKVCQRMAENWSKHAFKDVPKLRLTFSAGITEFKSPESVDQILERADSLLYDAKHNGRNCIVMEQQDLQVPLDLGGMGSGSNLMNSIINDVLSEKLDSDC